MPQKRLITRHVNAIAAQQRYILWLECKHTVSITARDVQAHPDRHYLEYVQAQSSWLCPHCPDPSPTQVRQEKSAQQLFAEEGEPDVW
jgi:hypothetical protein